jgi:phosphatidylserine/phosphatidylglycerophosphate/cardiolipin synthase-like enzyme
LINLFDSAQSRLDIAIYSITHPQIAQAIAGAKQRGVDVRLITDKGESNNENQRNVLNFLSNSGITVKEISHAGIMHLKISIIDEVLITTGTYNYSEAASTVNDDVLVAIRNSEIAREWSKQFQRMWQQ